MSTKLERINAINRGIAESNNHNELILGNKLKIFFANREFTFPNYALFLYNIFAGGSWTDNYVNDSARVLKYTGLKCGSPYIFIKHPRFDLSIKNHLENLMTYAPTYSEFTFLAIQSFIPEFRYTYHTFTVEQFKEFISNYKLPKWLQIIIDKQYERIEEVNSPYMFFKHHYKDNSIIKISSDISGFKELFGYTPAEWKQEFYRFWGLQSSGLLFDGAVRFMADTIRGYRKASGKFVKIQNQYYFILDMIENGVLLCMDQDGKYVKFPLYMKHDFKIHKEAKQKFWPHLQHLIDVDYDTYMKKRTFIINWRNFNDYRSYNGSS